MAAASDVPGKYDVVINGEGYMLADIQTIKAEYGYTPTFIQRQNVQGDFGDNQQEFWLTGTQRDWSLGEGQKFFRNTEQGLARFWAGSKVDIREPGQVSMRPANAAVTAAIAGNVGRLPIANTILVLSGNLKEIAVDGTVTDQGAIGMGAGADPSPPGVVTDGTDVFFTTENGSSVGVRKWTGSAFSTFSATAAYALAFLNNTLFGYRATDAKLIRYSTSGTASDIFQWKQADGGAAVGTATLSSVSMIPFGGRLVLIIPSGRGHQMWMYDGTAPAIIAQFPPTFFPNDIAELHGSLFVSGISLRNTGATNQEVRPTVYYYSNGTVGVLWRSNLWGSGTSGFPAANPWVAISVFDGGLVWNDDNDGTVKFYDPGTGGVHSITTFTTGGGNVRAFGDGIGWFILGTNGDAIRFPTSTYNTSATITSSLFDFDSSLDKLFRGVKIDFDLATDGNGGSVDIAYRVNDLDSSYTTLQTGATSGTEYTLSGVTGRSISIKLTLNKGTSTKGPVIKKMYVRAAPVQFSFRKETLLLNCTGRDGKSPVELRDNTLHSKTGLEMATNLRAAAASTSSISITDEFGTFTGVIDTDGFLIRRMRRGEFLAQVPVRSV